LAVGKDGMGSRMGTDFFFGRPQWSQSYLDETTLREIAKSEMGEFFRAAVRSLAGIFERIDSFGETENQENWGNDTRTSDTNRTYMFWGFILLFTWML